MNAMSKMRPVVKQNIFLCIGMAVFIAAILFINPFRETAMEDDWAYALTVKHLVNTGEYRLNDWLSANMPFQAYWGALFVSLSRYSFSSLRVSTLCLFFIGLLAFYYLAKEYDFSGVQAGFLTLCLLGSPLVMRFAFNFMTNVPFLACLIAALLLYKKAIRTRSFLLMFMASLAAAAAILTRQFGAALVAGLFSVWILERDRRRRFFLFLTGMALPAAAAAYQFLSGIISPTWFMRFNYRPN